MISWIKGKIIDIVPGSVILENQGIGYKIFVSVSDIKKGSSIELFIYQYLKEDRNELFGFKTKDEMMVFKLLLQVSGVGPKLALVIISHLPVGDIQSAIVGENPALFQSLPGVGPKLAAKIVVELKNKLSSESIDISHFSKHNDVVDGLMRLGYSQGEIGGILSKIPEDVTEQSEQIRLALQLLSHKNNLR